MTDCKCKLGRPKPPPGWLSIREAEVAGLVIGGSTNREVAATLFVTEKTVKFHLTNIYKKLRVKSRGEMIAGWYQNRLQEEGAKSIAHYCPVLPRIEKVEKLPETNAESLPPIPSADALPQGF